MTRRETPWLTLDNQEFLDAGTTNLRGGVVSKKMRSSYELPLSLRIVFDEDQERAAFEFRYAFEEDGRDFKLNDAILTVGKHSLRVLRIEVPASLEDAETPATLIKAVLPTALGALTRFRRKARRWRQDDNLYLTETAIRNDRLPHLAYAG